MYDFYLNSCLGIEFTLTLLPALINGGGAARFILQGPLRDCICSCTGTFHLRRLPIKNQQTKQQQGPQNSITYVLLG